MTTPSTLEPVGRTLSRPALVPAGNAPRGRCETGGRWIPSPGPAWPEARGPTGEADADPVRARLQELQRTTMQRIRAAESALDRVPLAVFGLRADASVLFANRQARALMDDGDGLSRVGGRLLAKCSADDAALRALLARAAAGRPGGAGGGAGGSIRIRRGTGRVPLAASVVAADAPEGDTRDLLLFVTDPDVRDAPPHETLCTVFDLTAREASVALAVVRLGTVPAVAAELRIAPSTARSHLQRVFDKTGARNQVALAQRLVEVGFLLRAAEAPRQRTAHVG